jgi:ABC-type sugar transport system ATPase subunit
MSLEQSAVVEVEGIDVRFGTVDALRGVSLRLHAGRIQALLGQNGAGKSTLIRVFSGAIAPDAGTVRIGGTAVELRSPAQAQAAGIAVVHQEGQLFPDLSVADNVLAARSPSRRVGPLRVRSRRLARRRAGALLTRLGVTIDPDSPVVRLPITERKIVEVARAIASDPRVLILDEPTAVLDPFGTERLLSVVRRLSDDGVAVLYVTHKLDEVLGLADSVAFLREGRMIERRDSSELDLGKLVEMLSHGHAGSTAPTDAPSGGSSLTANEVATDGLTPTSVDVRSGQIFAFTGMVGSGAGLLARVLAGARTRSAGTILVNGRPLRRGGRPEAVAAGVALVPEDRRSDGILPHRSIAENIAIGAPARVARWGVLSRRRLRIQARHYIDLLDIRPPLPDLPVASLSGGNQQKVLLARWLAAGSTVLVMEEPTHGLDVSAKADMEARLQRFAADGGSVVIVSLDIAEYLGLPTDVGVFRNGRLVKHLPGTASQAEVQRHAVGLS